MPGPQSEPIALSAQARHDLERLFALHLTFDSTEGQDFPMDRTHHARLVSQVALGR